MNYNNPYFKYIDREQVFFKLPGQEVLSKFVHTYKYFFTPWGTRKYNSVTFHGLFQMNSWGYIVLGFISIFLAEAFANYILYVSGARLEMIAIYFLALVMEVFFGFLLHMSYFRKAIVFKNNETLCDTEHKKEQLKIKLKYKRAIFFGFLLCIIILLLNFAKFAFVSYQIYGQFIYLLDRLAIIIFLCYLWVGIGNIIFTGYFFAGLSFLISYKKFIKKIDKSIFAEDAAHQEYYKQYLVNKYDFKVFYSNIPISDLLNKPLSNLNQHLVLPVNTESTPDSYSKFYAKLINTKEDIPIILVTDSEGNEYFKTNVEPEKFDQIKKKNLHPFVFATWGILYDLQLIEIVNHFSNPLEAIEIGKAGLTIQLNQAGLERLGDKFQKLKDSEKTRR